MKVKKILFWFLSIICFGFSPFVLTSCGEKPTSEPTVEPTSEPTSEPTVEPHVHNWNEIKRTEASCTEDGIITYLCVECEEFKDIIIEDAKGHTEIVDAAVEATCTETGLTEGSHCSTCNEVFVMQRVLAKTKHVFENGKCTMCSCDYFTQDLEFTLSTYGKYYSVTGIGKATETEIVIPSVYNNLPVTSIGDNAFDNCRSLTSIAIPNSVTSIGEDAFLLCTSLKSIVIPSGVTHIKFGTFSQCISLESITIPNSVTNIDFNAFLGCFGLKTVWYIGTEEQWNSIYIDSDFNKPLINANLICHIHDTINVLETTSETCLTDGEIVYYCESCNKSYSAIIPASGHIIVIDEAIEPTCTETGLTAGKHCAKCSEVLVAQEKIAARHNYIESVIEPTYKEMGYTTHTCDVCGDSFTDSYTPIAPLNTLLGFDEIEDGTFITNVRAVVTYIVGVNIFIQDVNRINGLVYYKNADTIQIGDTIIINGSKHTYNGYPEFVNPEIEILTGDLQLDSVSPIEVTADNVEELLVTTNNHATFKLVQAVVVEIGSNAKLLIGDTEIILYKAILPADVIVGDVIDVTCVMMCYKTAIQFRNCSENDITKY